MKDSPHRGSSTNPVPQSPPPVSAPAKEMRWTIIGEAPSRHRKRYVLCRCKCGTEREVGLSRIKTGRSRSCGCLAHELARLPRGKSPANRRHGAAGIGPTVSGRWPEYRAWSDMIQRCHNTRHKCYKYFGGKGITVCDRWRDFKAFIDDLGRRPSPEYRLVRRDKSRGYEPGNVFWGYNTKQNPIAANSAPAHQAMLRFNVALVDAAAPKTNRERLAKEIFAELDKYLNPAPRVDLDANPQPSYRPYLFGLIPLLSRSQALSRPGKLRAWIRWACIWRSV